MGLQLLTPPDANDPVATWEEAALQVKSEDPADQAELEDMVAAAVQMAEAYTRRVFVSQSWRYTSSEFPPSCPYERAAIVLPHPSLISVEAVKYVDVDGTLQTLNPSDYSVRTNVTPGEVVRAYGKSWPSTRCIDDSVQVDFTCGYGAAAAVPAPIKRAVLLIVGNFFRNRSSVITGTITAELPQNAMWLLGPYRVARMAA